MPDAASPAWLLKAESAEAFTDSEPGDSSRSHFSRSRNGACQISRAVVLAVIVLNNLIWIYAFRDSALKESWQARRSERAHLSYYLQDGAPDTVEIPFNHDWTGLENIEVDGYRYADNHWSPGSWAPPNGSVVAVSKDTQQNLGLDPRAAPTPDDDSKAYYLISGFHQLHCLHVMRDTIYYLNGTIEWPMPPFQWSHVLHCVEAVRQGLSCALDPTLIPLDTVWPGIPNGQTHTCRNFDALFRWAGKHGHDLPEFESVTDGPHTPEWLERMRVIDRTS